MSCVHLRKLYQLCQQHGVQFQLSSTDLIRIVCRECDAHDVCPSALTEECEAEELAEAEDENVARS